jgi:hypothetical protein
MRELIDKYRKILNETDYVSLRRRLNPELFQEIIETNVSSNQISESSLSRINKYIKNNQCAVISAFRKSLTNCLSDESDDRKINIFDNKGRNKKMYSALLALGYDVTKVKGTYIENYMQENAIEVKEDSYFVVNSTDDPKFIQNIIKLGELFCQDSVFIFDFGDNYLFGTNNSEFPGLANKINMGKFRPGTEGEFMTKVSGRPFTVENYKNLQINSKRLVKEWSKPIIDLL